MEWAERTERHATRTRHSSQHNARTLIRKDKKLSKSISEPKRVVDRVRRQHAAHSGTGKHRFPRRCDGRAAIDELLQRRARAAVAVAAAHAHALVAATLRSRAQTDSTMNVLQGYMAPRIRTMARRRTRTLARSAATPHNAHWATASRHPTAAKRGMKETEGSLTCSQGATISSVAHAVACSLLISFSRLRAHCDTPRHRGQCSAHG